MHPLLAANGSIPSKSSWIYKVRLVAQGYKQEYDVDYEETFAIIAAMTTALLSIATVRHWPYGK